MKYYVLGVWCDVAPFLSKSFRTKKARDKEARRMRKEDDEMDDSGIYRLDIDKKGKPSVSTYKGIELNPDEITVR
jgi:hypothetical protein